MPLNRPPFTTLKSVVAAALALALLVAAVPAAAQSAPSPAISRERAEQIVRDAFPIPANYRRVRADLRDEVARLLVTASGKSSGGLSRTAPAADWLGAAVKAGILDEGAHAPGAAEHPVRRGEFVAMLVRALGFGDLVRMPNAIETRFGDADGLDPQARNAAGIAQGLGLLRGAPGGRFAAADPVSWAELATLLVRAAPRFPPER